MFFKVVNRCFTLLFFSKFLFIQAFSESVTIVGAGYVGLIMGSIFSRSCDEVNFVDLDEGRISSLKKGSLYYTEPKLEEEFLRGLKKGVFSFYTDPALIKNPGIVFICTETPNAIDGKLNTSSVYQAIKTFYLRNQAVQTICIKSTLQPGTIKAFQKQFAEENISGFDLIYNPEFMREGSAIEDILTANPIVLGAEDRSKVQKIISLYQKVIHPHLEDRSIITDFSTAELIKLAWNGYSAMRITYANELSQLCASFDGDISTLLKGISFSEKLLPTNEIKPGCGFGGSCFPKDTAALSALFKEIGKHRTLIQQTIESNTQHMEKLIEKIISTNQKMSKIAIFGFSFKANTNDSRNSPTKKVVQELTNRGIKIKGYDPYFNEQMAKEFPQVVFHLDPYQTVHDVDCLIIMNDSKEILELDLDRIAKKVRHKMIFDFKNVFNPVFLNSKGFDYFNLGRKTTF